MITPLRHVLFLEDALRDLIAGDARAALYRAATVSVEEGDVSLPSRVLRYLKGLQPARIDQLDCLQLHNAVVGLIGAAPLMEERDLLPQLRALLVGAYRGALQELAQGLCCAGAATVESSPPSQMLPLWIATARWLGETGELLETAVAGLSQESALEEMARDLLAWRRGKVLREAAATCDISDENPVWVKGPTWRVLKGASAILHPFDESPGAMLIRLAENLLGMEEGNALRILRERLASMGPTSMAFAEQAMTVCDLRALLRAALLAQAHADEPTPWRVRRSRPSAVLVAMQIASSWGVPRMPLPRSTEALRVLHRMAERSEVVVLGCVPRDRAELDDLARALTTPRRFPGSVPGQPWPQGLTLLGVEDQLFLVPGTPQASAATEALWRAVRIFPLGAICAEAPPFLIGPTMYSLGEAAAQGFVQGAGVEKEETTLQDALNQALANFGRTGGVTLSREGDDLEVRGEVARGNLRPFKLPPIDDATLTGAIVKLIRGTGGDASDEALQAAIEEEYGDLITGKAGDALMTVRRGEAVHVILPGHVEQVEMTVGFEGEADHDLESARAGLMALLQQRHLEQAAVLAEDCTHCEAKAGEPCTNFGAPGEPMPDGYEFHTQRAIAAWHKRVLAEAAARMGDAEITAPGEAAS